jgi:murein DD-endopeptidase MepM/ murein hydrolase activator NlpD
MDSAHGEQPPRRQRSDRATPPGAGTMEFGDEPPLLLDGSAAGQVARRRLSVRWFAGTILTGFCGAALMGGAVHAVLDAVVDSAGVPVLVLAPQTAADAATRSALRKSARLPPPGDADSARRMVRMPTTTRAGERETVRMRPFLRVTANLVLSPSQLSASIPPFDPQKLLVASARAAAAGERSPEAGAEPDGEVSFVTRDLRDVLPRARVARELTPAQVLALVRTSAEASDTPAFAELTAVSRLAYATDANIDPYAGFAARLVPENVTLLSKAGRDASAPSERTIGVRKGDTAAAILRELGATPEEMRAITAALGPRGRDGGLKEGQKLRVLLAPAAGGQRLQPVRVIVSGDTVEAIVALSDTGRYLEVDLHNVDADLADAEDRGEPETNSTRLYQSIYETALRNRVPRPVVDDLVRIFASDVDVERPVQPGDSFDVVFGRESDAAGDGTDEVQFASLTLDGETRRYYRFQSPDDGAVDYYDESGKSARKLLVRKPVGAGAITSQFGYRHHPILGTTRLHTGVDWAAPYGTPIFAAGDGVAEEAGMRSGYGRHVRIRHADGYETLYGHMSGLARGIAPGVRVRQGQIIGYVGSSGQSTGPHVHYEILVNTRWVDPMRVRLPRSRVLDGTLLAGFERDRDSLDGALNQGPAQTAQAVQRPRPRR